jgi:hypothetical protein
MIVGVRNIYYDGGDIDVLHIKAYDGDIYIVRSQYAAYDNAEILKLIGVNAFIILISNGNILDPDRRIHGIIKTFYRDVEVLRKPRFQTLSEAYQVTSP